MLVWIIAILIYLAIGLGSAYLIFKLEGMISLGSIIVFAILWPMVLLIWAASWADKKRFYDK